MTFNSEYIEKNLIAYIGNKRRLLPLIINSIEKTGVLDREKANAKFLDPFRRYRCHFKTFKKSRIWNHTNDWEYYSYIMNSAFVGLEADFLEKTRFQTSVVLKRQLTKLKLIEMSGQRWCLHIEILLSKRRWNPGYE